MPPTKHGMRVCRPPAKHGEWEEIRGRGALADFISLLSLEKEICFSPLPFSFSKARQLVIMAALSLVTAVSKMTTARGAVKRRRKACWAPQTKVSVGDRGGGGGEWVERDGWCTYGLNQCVVSSPLPYPLSILENHSRARSPFLAIRCGTV